MESLKQKLGTFWWGVLFLFIISAIAYLPLVNGLGYVVDDWYLMYDMQVKGPDFFHEIFSIDRPGRALLMIPLFSLFGFDPLPYQLSAFLFRFLGGVCLFWTIRMLWEKRTYFALTVSLLFTIYPGFLSQPNAIDYQSHMAGLFLAMLSVALTIKSVLLSDRAKRTLLIAGSILAGWGYLSQMEYFIGVEVFRFTGVALLIWRTYQGDFWRKAKQVVTISLPFLPIAVGFLGWRLFFFESERAATDVGGQLSQFLSSPSVGLWWMNYLIQDIFTVTLGVWSLPLNMMTFSLRLRDIYAAIAWASLAGVMLLLGVRWLGVEESETESGVAEAARRETVWMALLTMVGGLLPVILVNRHVILPDYSRYSLIASIGAVMLLAHFFENISRRSMRFALTGVFVFIAVMTHYGNTIRFVNETAATREFWWQVAWRAPKIEEGVTLIVSYPGSPLSEDYYVWGPANFIYYPEKQDGNPVEIKLPATVLNGDAVNKIVTGGGIETPLRRGNYLQRDYESVLLMIQTHSNGCVRFINGDAPELSQWDAERLVLVAPHSQLDAVITDGASPQLPAIVFGDEPEQGWCYYYQKADLARQRRDWDGVLALLDEALEQGHYPNDPLEWMPFIQAYAVDGNVVKVRQLAALVTSDKVQRVRTCRVMRDLSEKENLSVEVNDFIENKICN
jgi:hypothetical protein